MTKTKDVQGYLTDGKSLLPTNVTVRFTSDKNGRTISFTADNNVQIGVPFKLIQDLIK